MLPGLKSTTKIKYDSLCNINILGAGCVVGCDGKDKERIINVPRPKCQTIYNTELLIINLITYQLGM